MVWGRGWKEGQGVRKGRGVEGQSLESYKKTRFFYPLASQCVHGDGSGWEGAAESWRGGAGQGNVETHM